MSVALKGVIDSGHGSTIDTISSPVGPGLAG